MNRYLIGAVILLLSLIGTFAAGAKVGSDHEIAKHATDEQLIAAAEERTQKAVAEAIAKMKPQQTITRQVLEREIRTVPDYSRCVNSDDGMRAINDALANRPTTNGNNGVPDAHAP